MQLKFLTRILTFDSNNPEQRKIIDNLNCKFKTLIYLIEWNTCKCQYIRSGENKRHLNERFGEHRRSILNHHHLSDPTPVHVSFHFNQPGRSINEVRHLIPLEFIRSNRDAVRKAREALLIRKEKKFILCRNNYRHDEARWYTILHCT